MTERPRSWDVQSPAQQARREADHSQRQAHQVLADGGRAADREDARHPRERRDPARPAQVQVDRGEAQGGGG